jgi:acyl-CoA synthetase (AMP-forming)/AMP-acid ligase II
VLDLFNERVAAEPNRPALRYRDVTMTYAELANAANATAT